jgi:hypothetical protein
MAHLNGLSAKEQLLHWRTLYGRWVGAELELRQARTKEVEHAAVAELELKVRRLQQECHAALDAIDALLAASRGRRPEEADSNLRA